MIAHLIGNVSDIYDDRIVIDVNGMGFNVFVPASYIDGSVSEGMPLKLYTYTAVREDAFNLFGFITKEELFLFKKLITVNGIGPKGALSVLSYLDAEALKYAILTGDSKTLSLSPGIGKKTAERIILDLKDKLDWTVGDISKEAGLSDSIKTSGNDSDRSEAVSALVALGYGAKEAAKAVSMTQLPDGSDVESILKEALKYLI